MIVYSYVPEKLVEEILSKGLYSSEALLNDFELLAEIANSRGITPQEFIQEIQGKLSSDARNAFLGPSVVFKMVPPNFPLLPNHPLKTQNLVPIEIDLEKLVDKIPGTKLFGLELKPNHESSSLEEREHFLQAEELEELSSMSADELWGRYNDLDRKGLYAPDVPHASIHVPGGIIPPEFLKRTHSGLSWEEQQDLINQVKQRSKQNETVKEVFDKYQVSLDEIDLIPTCFADLDVSARTDHGVIYLNWKLLDDGDFSKHDHYFVHEVTHFPQQTTGNGPTKGSTDDTYLDNPYEIEAFQAQTKYLSETRSDQVAEKYIEKVLDHHEVPKKERSKRRKELLELASQLWSHNKMS